MEYVMAEGKYKPELETWAIKQTVELSLMTVVQLL
jgi:hypothetical protein